MNPSKHRMSSRSAAGTGLILSLLAFGAFAGRPDGAATPNATAVQPAYFVQDNIDSSRLEAKLFLHRPGFVISAGATR